MKYLLACLVIPTAHILFVAVFLLGALCFGMASLMSRMKRERTSGRVQQFTGRRNR